MYAIRSYYDYNSDRKEEDKRITEEALIQIINNGEQNKFTTVVYQEDWHKGVIGIVASRLTETYYRPTLVVITSYSIHYTKLYEWLVISVRVHRSNTSN